MISTLHIFLPSIFLWKYQMYRKVERSGWRTPVYPPTGFHNWHFAVFIWSHIYPAIHSLIHFTFWCISNKFCTCFSKCQHFSNFSHSQNVGDTSHAACILIWDVSDYSVTAFTSMPRQRMTVPLFSTERSLKCEVAGLWIKPKSSCCDCIAIRSGSAFPQHLHHHLLCHPFIDIASFYRQNSPENLVSLLSHFTEGETETQRG